MDVNVDVDMHFDVDVIVEAGINLDVNFGVNVHVYVHVWCEYEPVVAHLGTQGRERGRARCSHVVLSTSVARRGCYGVMRDPWCYAQSGRVLEWRCERRDLLCVCR